MTKEKVIEALRLAAKAMGFETKESDAHWGFPEIVSDYLNFTYSVDMTSDTDWKALRVGYKLTVAASIARMGGQPTAEELLKAAREIRDGAMLVQDLRFEDLTWVEDLREVSK